MELLQILDTNLIEHLDILKLALLSMDKYSLLPEINDIFGPEYLLKFLDLFSGTTIKVPHADDINIAVRDSHIYVELKKAPKEIRHNVVENLVSRYGITASVVEMQFACMQKLVEHQSYKVSQYIQDLTGV